jgi:hypothetical protein
MIGDYAGITTTEERTVSAFNIVRFRVKAGSEQPFIDAHRSMKPNFEGFVGGNLVRTGDQTFCLVGEWRDFSSLAAARPEMIGLLDGLRHMLEDLGAGLGVTDPVSGDSVASIALPTPAKQAGGKKAKRKAKTKAKKTSKKSAKKKSKSKKKAKKKATKKK